MRKLMMVAMVAGLGLGMSQDAAANFFFPGQVIIIGGGNGGGGGGTTKSARAAAMGPCAVNHIVCECYPGKTLLDACKVAGVPTQCLTTDTPYEYVEQSEPVIKEGPKQELGYLVCTGESNSTATVKLVVEGQEP
jgi:hypothetical protein